MTIKAQIKNCDLSSTMLVEVRDSKGVVVSAQTCLPGDFAYVAITDDARLCAGAAAPPDKQLQPDARTPGQVTYEAQMTAAGKPITPWASMPRPDTDAWEAAAQATFRSA